MLEIKNVSKIYVTEDLKQVALDKVSINFRKSEFVSILGPSGSGKTTLLNIIGGLDHYDKGDLIINNVSTKEYKDRDWDSYRNHRVGFVFQSYNLISHQTILQNVELALTLSGVSPKERAKRAKEALKNVGLERHLKKKPNQLSGGQMQRVAIARALINDPDIILADEPTGALDSETSKQIMELLKNVSKDKLVVMVTHNPELANVYSNRIISLKDGKIMDDSNPFDGKEESESSDVTNKKSKKTQMSFKTSLALSMNNLITKKGRTILTSFAGSIGIIGIALILSLSHGIQKYIDKTEKETLSSYPITIEKSSVDMSTFISTLTGTKEETLYDDNNIHSLDIMGDMLSTISTNVKTNDLESFKNYLENDGKEINDYVSDIQYAYDITLNLYKNDDTVTKVNPTTVLDSLGMGTSSYSSAYSSFMSSYDVFTELIDNNELLETQYDIVAGRLPENYDEVVIEVNENNEISDYTLYSLGILSQNELKEKFNSMVNGEEVYFESHSYTPDEFLNLSFKMVLTSDYYKKVNGLWVNMEDDEDYVKSLLENALTIKVVGIIKPNEEAVVSNSSGMVYYTHDLVKYIINETNKSQVVKEQMENKDKNVLTGLPFNTSGSLDYSSLTKEQLSAINKMSTEELASYMEMIANTSSSTYESTLTTLGYADLNNPSTIYIYPKDFDSKENIENIINEYNKDKSENDQITYTDYVGMMMSSVSKIVSVISDVLIAFVAISLVVSCIMIAIITYISVIERTKEIGILRSIGASKKDIRRVFNAETLIEGSCAGILGIIITLILDIPINIIIKHLSNISGIASLPINGAIILIIISILLTMLAGFIPANIAGKKDPVEALRTE